MTEQAPDVAMSRKALSVDPSKLFIFRVDDTGLARGPLKALKGVSHTGAGVNVENNS